MTTTAMQIETQAQPTDPPGTTDDIFNNGEPQQFRFSANVGLEGDPNNPNAQGGQAQ